MFLKCIFEVIEVLLVFMGGHLQRGGACIVITIGKSGIIAIPGKQLFLFPRGWSPRRMSLMMLSSFGEVFFFCP